MEIYKGGWFYKVSMKNCTIKPRTAPNKIKKKFKKFLFLIHNIMKKSIYYLGADRVFLPKRLGKLLQIYGKPVKTMLEYDPSEVDDKRGVGSLYYLSGSIEEQGFTGTLYGSRENAEMQKKENTKLAIGRVMQEKGYRIKEFDEKTARIKELEKENDELKSLPPVNVENIDCDIYPDDDPRSKFYKEKFDEKLNENLTENKKRGRSTLEK